jgi:stalled ribosome rescue protein Dom34
MKSNVGVWIDRRKAVFVRVTDDVEKVHSIESDSKKNIRYSSGKPDDRQAHRFSNHLKEYYAKVVSSLHDADSIFLLGPGKTKVEIKKRLEKEALGDRIAGIETVNKMTDYQLAMKVLNHFLNPAKQKLRIRGY